MATITLRTDEQLRKHSALVVRAVHGKSLNSFVVSYLRQIVAEARAKRPELFQIKPLDELSKVDRFLYRLLTEEGRATVDDLMRETRLPRATVQASMVRLTEAHLLYTVEQGQASDGQPGAKKILYVSWEEATLP